MQWILCGISEQSVSKDETISKNELGLSKVLIVKCVRAFNFSQFRLDKLNETNIIAENFLRLVKLEHIRFEMPK